MGISLREFTLLKHLIEASSLKTLPLSKLADIPRTTVAYLLKKMETRDLVRHITINNHQEWRVSLELKKLLLREMTSEEFSSAYYHNIEHIEKILENILKDSSQERIYFIEPYVQTQKYLSYISHKEQLHISELFQKHHNISEGISSEKNLVLLHTYNTTLLKNMSKRMAIIYVVPDEDLCFEEMIIVYKDMVYTFNFNVPFALEIKNQPLANSMKSLIKALRKYGRKINTLQYIQEILNKRN